MQWFLCLEAKESLGLKARFSLGNKLHASSVLQPWCAVVRAWHSGWRTANAVRSRWASGRCCRLLPTGNWLAGSPCQGAADLQRRRKPSHPWEHTLLVEKLWTGADSCGLTPACSPKLWMEPPPSKAAVPCLVLYQTWEWSSCLFPTPSSFFMAEKLKTKTKNPSETERLKTTRTAKPVHQLWCCITVYFQMLPGIDSQNNGKINIKYFPFSCFLPASLISVAFFFPEISNDFFQKLGYVVCDRQDCTGVTFWDHHIFILWLVLWAEKKERKMLHTIQILRKSEDKYGELLGLHHTKWNISIDYASSGKFLEGHYTESKLMKCIRKTQLIHRDIKGISLCSFVLLCVIKLRHFVSFLQSIQQSLPVWSTAINILYKSPDSQCCSVFPIYM